jgi:hypothetical protein
MKLEGLSMKDLRKLEWRIEKDIKDTEGTIAAEQRKLKKLGNECCQVKTRRRQLEYKERLRRDFSLLTLVEI